MNLPSESGGNPAGASRATPSENQVPGGRNCKQKRAAEHDARAPNQQPFADTAWHLETDAARNRRAAVGVDIRQDFAGGLIAKLGVALEAVHDNARHPIRQIRIDKFRIFWFFLDALVHHLPGRFSRKGKIARHHFIEHEAEGVKIAALIDLSAFDLLRGHVTGRTDESAAARHAHFCGFKRSGKAEIGNVDLIFFSDEDVVRFEIAMNDAFGMSGVECFTELPDELEAAVERKGVLFLKNVVKVRAVHKSHGDELHAVGFAQIVNAQNVLVRDSAGEKKLVFESLNDLGIAGKVGLQDFQGDKSVELAVIGFIDTPHAAFAEKRFNHKSRPEFLSGFKQAASTGTAAGRSASRGCAACGGVAGRRLRGRGCPRRGSRLFRLT